MTHEAAEIAKLADRVEAATGPDRGLDALAAPLAGLRVVNEGHPLGICCYDSSHRLTTLPAYTRSIDAAMSLIPEADEASGERFRLEAYVTNGVLAEHVRASAWVPGAPRAYAATPALALTAAALRARAIISEKGEQK